MHAVITTKHRGVFFGEIAEVKSIDEANPLEVSDAQMCVRWSRAMLGVLGLASHGPDKNCRVSRPVPGTMQLYDVTAIIPATDEATERWKSCPWS